MEKLLKSAVANAENNHGMNTPTSFTLRKFTSVLVRSAKALCRVHRAVHSESLARTSHVTLVLGEKE